MLSDVLLIWLRWVFLLIKDENKEIIAKSGILVPLTKLANSKDLNVQVFIYFISRETLQVRC